MMVESTPSRVSPSERSAKENMGIISWIVVGLIAGALAKLVLPGDDPGGIIVTAIIGMVGAVVGGFVFGIFGGTGATGFNVWSITGGYGRSDRTAAHLPPDRWPENYL